MTDNSKCKLTCNSQFQGIRCYICYHKESDHSGDKMECDVKNCYCLGIVT
jgi:hypothetical protein